LIPVDREVLIRIDGLGHDLEGRLSFRREDFEGSFETEDEGGFETCDDGRDGGEVVEVETSLQVTQTRQARKVSEGSRRTRNKEGKEERRKPEE